MSRMHALKKSKQGIIVKLSFLLLFSIPFVVLGLSSRETFDTRKRAFEELKLSEENPCIISLPNVNPYSLEVGKTVRVSVDAKLSDENITEIQLTDSTGASIYRESFSDDEKREIATSFEFTPQTSGMIDMLGILTKESGKSVACKISSPYDIKGIRAISNNSSPEFSSNPSSSQPSQDIKVGQNYEYTLTATDADKDRINYSYSFTPRAEWLKEVVLEDGGNGSLKIKFKGTPTKPASYLAYVLIHDGYSSHVRTQSWIISAGQNENDMPKIKITEPSAGLRINQGETFKASWQATDLNHISRYQIFMTTNPSDESKWISIEKNLPYNTDRYNITTQKLTPGTYNLLIQATDNQTPPKTGIGISSEIVISKIGNTEEQENNEQKVDDQVFISQPQITNMSPSNTDKITYFKPTIKATIIASDNEKINQDTIQCKIDNKDISKTIKINRISDKEFTILYQPEENLSVGEHKVEITFEDTAKKTVTKSWTFTISKEENENQNGEISIFGYPISRKTIIIVITGVAIVTLAILAPFLISSIWKNDGKIGEDSIYLSNKVVKTMPTETEMFMISNADREEVRQKVENTSNLDTEEEKHEENLDNFSAPLLQEQEETTHKPTETIPSTSDSTKAEVENWENREVLPEIEEQEIVTTPQTETENIAEIQDTTPTHDITDEEILKTIPDMPVQPIENIPPSQEQDIPTTDEEILQTIPDMPVQPIENIHTSQEQSIQQSSTEIQSTPLQEESFTPQVEQLQSVKPIQPEQTVEEQQPITTSDTAIPEPEAPAPEDLQKIFEQIQKTGN